METVKNIKKLENVLLLLVVFLVPLAFAPISPNLFIPAKLAVLAFGISAIVILKAIRLLMENKLNFSVSNFDLPVLIFALAYGVSTYFATPEKAEAFLLPGTTTAVLGGALLYYLIAQLKKNKKEKFSRVLAISGLVSALVLLIAYSNKLNLPMFDSLNLPAYLRSRFFNTNGSYLGSIVFFVTLLPISIGMTMRNKNKIKELVLPTAVVVMIVLATLVTGYAIFTSINAEDANSIVNLPSAKGSWSVAIDTLQDSPIFGAGAGNYLTAFSRYRPIAHNSTDLWNTKFTTANSFYLTTITETGLVGAAAVVFLILALYRRVKEDMKTKKERKVVKWGSKADHNMVSLVVLSALFLFLPADPANIVLLFVLLGLSSKSSEKNSMKLVGGSQDGAMKLTSIIFAIPVIIVFLVVITNASSILAAEYTFKTGLDALVANDGVTTHDTIRKAINKNPRVSRYRATMSQVSLGLANSIASAGDGEVTDQGRQTIAQLVQQSVDEAKAAVAINPTRADNWGLLAGTYNSVARLAEGAADFAVQSYSQAIALDPLNPSTRVALGGLYFAAGEYSQAIRTFELAIAAKPDLANAHFNLAFALKEDGQIDNAIREMTIVLSLVDTESNDFTVATEALDALETSRDELVTESDNLTPPNDGEQILQPPLDLPENSQPPEAVVVGEEEKVNEALPTPTIIP